MPKMKPHKGTLKRVKITGSGKVKYKKTGLGHLNSHLSGDKVRKLNKPAYAQKGDIKRLERALVRPLRPADSN